MRLQISDAVIKSASRCDKGRACIQSAGHVYCSVAHCVMHRIHFVECLNEKPCPYKTAVERAAVCTCPVRKEVFNRYGR